MGGRLGQGPEEGGICLIHVVVEQKPAQHRKAIIFQLNFFLKKADLKLIKK